MTGESNSSAQPISVPPTTQTERQNTSHTGAIDAIVQNVAQALGNDDGNLEVSDGEGGFDPNDLVPHDEVEDTLEVHEGNPPKRLTRQRTKSHTAAPATTQPQTAATATTSSKDAQRAAELERHLRTSSNYAAQIDSRCQAMLRVMQDPPNVTVGRKVDGNEADDCYNNDMAQGLLKSHIDRLKKLDHEVEQVLVLWSNFENSLTTKKASLDEAARRGDFLSKEGGYEELKLSLQDHLFECETKLTRAVSTIRWYENLSNNQRLHSGASSPLHGWSRSASPLHPSAAEEPPAKTTHTHTTAPTHTRSESTIPQTLIVTTGTESFGIFGSAFAPISSAGLDFSSFPSGMSATSKESQTIRLNSQGSDFNRPQTVSRESQAPSSGFGGFVVRSAQADQAHTQRRVVINPQPTAVYSTPVMSPHTNATTSPNQQTEVVKLVKQLQLQQQQQAQQLQQQQHLAQLLQQQQQFQGTQQQELQKALFQQLQDSQQATLQMVAALIKELKQPATDDPHTSSGQTRTTAPRPEGSRQPPIPGSDTTPEHGGSGDGEDDAVEDQFEEPVYPYRGGTNGFGEAHSYNRGGFAPVRGAFAGRGRGGTPTYRTPPQPTPAASQFKLPEPEPFRGDIRDWPRFWEEWTHYITQTNPDDISKCRLLKKLLQGTAKELTQCYRDTAADYKNLTEALKESYDQPDILLSYLQRKLRDMRIPDRENAASLRSFLIQIQALCRQLTDAGRDTDDPMITDTIYSKLPAKMKVKVAEQRLANPADGWSTHRLLQLMKAHVRLAEHISLSNDVQHAAVERKDVPHHRNVHAIRGTSPDEDDIPGSDLFDDENSYATKCVPHSGQPLSYDSRLTSSNVAPASNVVLQLYGEEATRYMQDKASTPQNKRSQPPHMHKWKDSDAQRKPSGPLPCLFCASSKHRSTNCDKYTTVVARRNRITGPDTAFRRCTDCLSSKHDAQACRRRATCRSCMRRGKKPAECAHHHLMCPLKHPYGSDQKERNNVHLLASEDTDEYHRSFSHASVQRESADSDVDSVDYGYTDSEAEEPHAYVIRKEEEDVKNVFFLGEPQTRKTLMMTAKVDVSNASDVAKKRQCTIFFDCGSSVTLIEKAFARQLDLPILKGSTSTFRSFADGGQGREMDTWDVQFDVHLSDGTCRTLDATAVDEVCGPLPTMDWGPGPVAEVLAVSHKAFTVIMDQPQILIGLDHMHEFDLVRQRKRLPNGFSLYTSQVGPIICGQGKIRAHKQGGGTKQVRFSNLKNQAKNDGLIRSDTLEFPEWPKGRGGELLHMELVPDSAGSQASA